MRLQFCGAARQVTGSCFHFTTAHSRFLVDCGMFQGGRQAAELNYGGFAFEPRELDFVVVTHAHIDHSGMLPRLMRAGFTGPIYATGATVELLHIMLPDSAYVQEMEAQRSSGRGRGRARPPLYSVEEARAVLRQLRAVRYHERFEPGPAVSVLLRDAGHILGSAIVELGVDEGGRHRRVVVTGDLGQPGRPILRDPEAVPEADVLLIESTYGNRLHKSLESTLDEFVEAVTRTLASGDGNVIIPAFAVGRTQEILYFIAQLRREGRLPPMRVFVDSPMATEVTALTLRHPHLFDDEARQLAALTEPVPEGLEIRFTESLEDSMAINRIQSGAVIIAGSGMCNGGRIRHHLRLNLPREGCTVLFTGFQAAGTLGRRLVDGAETVRIFGEDIPVKAKVVTLGGFSAHADQAALLDWLGSLARPPERLFLVHGEAGTMESFAGAIQARFGWEAEMPAIGDEASL
jgi:metallo-beta-lactamase family protein